MSNSLTYPKYAQRFVKPVNKIGKPHNVKETVSSIKIVNILILHLAPYFHLITQIKFISIIKNPHSAQKLSYLGKILRNVANSFSKWSTFSFVMFIISQTSSNSDPQKDILPSVLLQPHAGILDRHYMEEV